MNHQHYNPAESYSLRDNPAVVSAIAARTAARPLRAIHCVSARKNILSTGSKTPLATTRRG